MKSRKIAFTVSGILLIILLAGIIYFFMGGRSYELHLPPAENLKSISLEQNNIQTTIDDSKEIEEILGIIGGEKRTTRKESIQDAPVNAEGEIKIDFHFSETGISTLFVYKKNNRYYIEQPYNGIYQINEEEYHSIEHYVTMNEKERVFP